MDPAEGSPDRRWQRLFLVGQHFHAAVRLDDEKDKLQYRSATSFWALRKLVWGKLWATKEARWPSGIDVYCFLNCCQLLAPVICCARQGKGGSAAKMAGHDISSQKGKPTGGLIEAE